MVTMMGDTAPPSAVIYGSIGLGCLLQIINVILLLQDAPIQIFVKTWTRLSVADGAPSG